MTGDPFIEVVKIGYKQVWGTKSGVPFWACSICFSFEITQLTIEVDSWIQEYGTQGNDILWGISSIFKLCLSPFQWST